MYIMIKKKFTLPGCIFLSFASLISGCASTTMLETTPTKAFVYIKGGKRGITPYQYSDRKIAFSRTHVSFRKAGYYNLDTVLIRNEQPNPVPIMFFFEIVPLLWFLKYNPEHSFIMVRDSLITLPVASAYDTLKAGQNLNELPESDTSDFVPEKKLFSIFGLGFGACSAGGLWDLDLLISGTNGWGGGFGYTGSIIKSKNIPTDYFSDKWRVFSPSDYLNILSFNVIKEFPLPAKSARLGLDLGPSLVIFSTAEFMLNPDYPSPLSIHKYYTYHNGVSVPGLSLRTRLEIPISHSFGITAALFGNINSIKSIAGFEFLFNFGHVKN